MESSPSHGAEGKRGMKHDSMMAWIGRRAVRVDKRYSAALTYRVARAAGIDRRMAYLCAVARYGWDRQSRMAWGTCQGWSKTRGFLSRP